MEHFNKLYYTGDPGWSKGEHPARFENANLYPPCRNSTNDTIFVGGEAEAKACQLDERVLRRMQSKASSKMFPPALPPSQVAFHHMDKGIIRLGPSKAQMAPEISTKAAMSEL